MTRSHEAGVRRVAFACALISVLTTLGIVVTLLRGAAPFFRAVPPLSFAFGTQWRPGGSPPRYGVLPLAWGTLVVTAGAGLLAMPLGLMVAVYLREVARPAVRRVLKPTVETLAGVPAVVYGYLGLTLVTPALRRIWPETQATNALAGAIVVGIMVLPTASSLCEEALGAVPRGLRDAADGLGSTRAETTLRIVLPSARRGILAAFVLAVSRALGETIAVALAAGSSPSLSLDPRRSVETMGAFIVGASEGDAATGSTKYTALFAVGAALFALTLGLNLLASRLIRPPSPLWERGGSAEARNAKGARGVGWRPFSGRWREGSGAPFSEQADGEGAPTLPFPKGEEPPVARRPLDRLFGLAGLAAIALAAALVALLLGRVLLDGLPRLNPGFALGRLSSRAWRTGVGPALAGSLWTVALTALVAVPVGVAAAVYLEELSARGTRLARLVLLNVSNLAGVPGVVYGLLGLAVFVRGLRMGSSVLAASLTLALLVLPTVILVTGQALRAVPIGLREASLGLGASPWATIRHQVLPAAAPGILTGVILSLARALGETAPLVVVGAVVGVVSAPASPTDRFTTLPVQIFNWARDADPGFHAAAAAAIVVLMAILLLFGALASWLRARATR